MATANKLLPSKAAVLPLGPVLYSRQYQDQLNNILRLYFNQIDSVTQTLAANVGGRFLGFPYGEYLDTTNQVAGSDTSAYAMRLNTSVSFSGISIGNRIASFAATITNGAASAGTTLTVTVIIPGDVIYLGMELTGTGIAAGTRILSFISGTGGIGTYTVNISQLIPSPLVGTVQMTGSLPSQIRAEFPGIYNVQLAAQFVNASASTVDVDVWFRKNEANISNSNCIFTVPPNGQLVAAFSFIIEIRAADSVEIMWHTASTDTYLGYTGPAVSPVRPATPSVIASMNFVSSLPA